MHYSLFWTSLKLQQVGSFKPYSRNHTTCNICVKLPLWMTSNACMVQLCITACNSNSLLKYFNTWVFIWPHQMWDNEWMRKRKKKAFAPYILFGWLFDIFQCCDSLKCVQAVMLQQWRESIGTNKHLQGTEEEQTAKDKINALLHHQYFRLLA